VKIDAVASDTNRATQFEIIVTFVVRSLRIESMSGDDGIEEKTMSTTVTMEEAQANLPELVARLTGGDEVIITQDQKPVAKLIRQAPTGRKPRKPGNCKGMITIVSDDDEHLKDFAEYM